MCPFCLATAAWIAVGAASTGGFSALVVHSLRDKDRQPAIGNKNYVQGERHGQEQ
jgi:hypothetical protein